MSSNLVRWGGLASIVAGVMNALTGILTPLAAQEVVFDSFSDYLIEVLFVLALAGTLLAIAGLHVLQRGSYGRTGAAGSLTAFVGHALLLSSGASAQQPSRVS